MLVGCEAVDVLQCALYGIISQCGSPYAIVPFLLFSSFSLSLSVLACLDVTVVTAVGIIHTVNMIYSWRFGSVDLRVVNRVLHRCVSGEFCNRIFLRSLHADLSTFLCIQSLLKRSKLLPLAHQ